MKGRVWLDHTKYPHQADDGQYYRTIWAMIDNRSIVSGLAIDADLDEIIAKVGEMYNWLLNEDQAE